MARRVHLPLSASAALSTIDILRLTTFLFGYPFRLFFQPSLAVPSARDNQWLVLSKSFSFLVLTALVMNVVSIPFGRGDTARSPGLFLLCLVFTGLAGGAFGLAVHLGCRLIGANCNYTTCFTYCNCALNMFVLTATTFMALGIFAIAMLDLDLLQIILLPTALVMRPLTPADITALLSGLAIGALGIFLALLWFAASWRAFSLANGLRRGRSIAALGIAVGLVIAPIFAVAAALSLMSRAHP